VTLEALAHMIRDFGFGLIFASIAFTLCWLIVRSTRKLQEREDARRNKPFTPAGSDDLRRAMRYQGISPELLGKERVGFADAATRDERRAA
jgi:hypothetical protein